ncbi:hypothetical protein EDB87DRAFT_574710 [Lactarius vividus]|nr:hypothetical protein EDB87DRAFT_574710 [Lactarius vividus]
MDRHKDRHLRTLPYNLIKQCYKLLKQPVPSHICGVKAQQRNQKIEDLLGISCQCLKLPDHHWQSRFPGLPVTRPSRLSSLPSSSFSSAFLDCFDTSTRAGKGRGGVMELLARCFGLLKARQRRSRPRQPIASDHIVPMTLIWARHEALIGTRDLLGISRLPYTRWPRKTYLGYKVLARLLRRTGSWMSLQHRLLSNVREDNVPKAFKLGVYSWRRSYAFCFQHPNGSEKRRLPFSIPPRSSRAMIPAGLIQITKL